MYSLPQEIEVWYIIPAVRRELAKIFTSKYKLKQKEAAKILGVSKAAISQYMHSKRAESINFPAKISKEIERSAAIIIENKKTVIREILRLLSIVKKTKNLCPVCKKYNKGVLSICSMRPEAEIK